MRAAWLIFALSVGCVASPDRANTDDDAAWDAGDPVDASTPDGGPDPQRDYTFGDCPLRDQGCPRLLTYACALEEIRLRRATCAVDGDCAFEPWSDCVGMYDCSGGAAVSRAGQEAFRAEAGVERERYCTEARCRGGASCGARTPRLACVDAVCTAVAADGGEPADPPSPCGTIDSASGWQVAKAVPALDPALVSVPPGTTYWEARNGSGVVLRWGALCAGSSDQAACAAAFDTLAQDAITCSPEGCALRLSWQAGSNQVIGLHDVQARALLGDVISETEAVLQANLAHFSTGSSGLQESAVRTTSEGFEVIATAITSSCQPLRLERFGLAFSGSLAPRTVCRDVISEDPSSCI